MTNRLKEILKLYQDDEFIVPEDKLVLFSDLDMRVDSYADFEDWCLDFNDLGGKKILAKQRYTENEAKEINSILKNNRVEYYLWYSKNKKKSFIDKLDDALDNSNNLKVSDYHYNDININDIMSLSEYHIGVFREVVSVIPKNHRMLKQNNIIWKGYDTNNYIPALIQVALHKEYWIRELDEFHFKTKNPFKLFKSLIDHLFVKYPLNNSFYSIWFKKNLVTISKNKGIKTFIEIAQGISLKDAFLKSSSFGMEDNIRKFTKKDFHKLSKNSSLNIDILLRKIELEKYTDNKILINSILNSRFSERSETHDDLLFELMIFTENENMFDRNQFLPLFDYVNYLKNEYRREERDFFLKRRSLVILMNGMHEWHKSIGRDDRYPIWTGSGIEDFKHIVGNDEFEENNIVYTIKELKTSEQLRDEGKALSHCVGSYASSCYHGRCFIFSLVKRENFNEKRLITIEVDSNRRIVQIRGKFNRFPKENEKNIIERWAKKEGLIYDK